MLTKEDLQAIINGISPLIDARAKTTESLIKGYIHGEIKSAKDELREELGSDILAARAEAKVDHLDISSKINTVIRDYRKRIEALEEATNTPNPNKN
jgi:hypothetical protein